MNGALCVRHAARACADAGKSAPTEAPFIPAMSPAHGTIGIVSHETRRALFFRQPLAPIFKPPGQPGYGDKRPS